MRASLFLLSTAVRTRTGREIWLHIAHFRVISVSFSHPTPLPVFCSGVYCTAGRLLGQCISQVAIWACFAFVVGGRRGAVSQPLGCYIAASLRRLTQLASHTRTLFFPQPNPACTLVAHLVVGQRAAFLVCVHGTVELIYKTLPPSHKSTPCAYS